MGGDDVCRVFDTASVRGYKPDCSDLLDDARWMWVHKYPLWVDEENVLAYARFLYGCLPFDVGTVRLVSATEPMAEWERELLDQHLGKHEATQKIND